jgi:sec-independent protein translocase protein TatA
VLPGVTFPVVEGRALRGEAGRGARYFFQRAFSNISLPKGDSMFEGLFQPMHLLVIFGIALLVFGPKKLPELGKGIGEGIRGFKSAMKQEEEKNDAAG